MTQGVVTMQAYFAQVLAVDFKPLKLIVTWSKLGCTVPGNEFSLKFTWKWTSPFTHVKS
jgi:hypothetical protein